MIFGKNENPVIFNSKKTHFMQPLISLESTTYPGTTREILLPKFENIYRSVNIDIVNELKMFVGKMAIDDLRESQALKAYRGEC